LLIPAKKVSGASGTVMEVGPQQSGFDYLTFEVIRLKSGEKHQAATGKMELGIVALGGRFAVHSSSGNWESIGGRENVFAGMPWALYLPIKTSFTLTALTDCDLAFCYSVAEELHPAALISPDQVRIEIRGGANATRQINHIITPEFPAHRLLLVEVYTPGGNWSSYPPHKHDASEPCPVVNEEIYYYRIASKDQVTPSRDGIGYHRTYTGPEHEEAGLPAIDELVEVRDHDVVLVPHGYHGPCTAAPGYPMYYLNVMAGPGEDRAMAFCDDPMHGWVRDSWEGIAVDPRLPVTSATGRQG
jgi:5-deoxy-glucuronate isomerase